MKTELSHNKIALYKSIRVKPFKCIYDHLIFRITFFSLYVLLFSLLFSPLLTLLSPLTCYLVRSLQAINSSATTCGFWLSLMRASILRT